MSYRTLDNLSMMANAFAQKKQRDQARKDRQLRYAVQAIQDDPSVVPAMKESLLKDHGKENPWLKPWLDVQSDNAALIATGREAFGQYANKVDDLSQINMRRGETAGARIAASMGFGQMPNMGAVEDLISAQRDNNPEVIKRQAMALMSPQDSVNMEAYSALAAPDPFDPEKLNNPGYVAYMQRVGAIPPELEPMLPMLTKQDETPAQKKRRRRNTKATIEKGEAALTRSMNLEDYRQGNRDANREDSQSHAREMQKSSQEHARAQQQRGFDNKAARIATKADKAKALNDNKLYVESYNEFLREEWAEDIKKVSPDRLEQLRWKRENPEPKKHKHAKAFAKVLEVPMQSGLISPDMARDMLKDMETRYQKLRRDGKSDSEAKEMVLTGER